MEHQIEIREVGFESLSMIAGMNRRLFGEERVINRFDRPDLVMLVAYVDNVAVGFKIGYGTGGDLYYSAKGGVMEPYRRVGIARELMLELMEKARARNYRRFAFDTFPNVHVGMTLLAIAEGFILTKADFSEGYQDYRLRFTKDLGPVS